MKTFCFKLYRSKRNKHLHQQIDVAGIIYNYCIAAHRRYFGMFGKSLNAFALQKHITKLKKREDHQFWKLVGSQAIQDIVQRIDRAYHLFFENLKRKARCSPPGFKKVKRYKSFTLKQAGYSLFPDNRVRIADRIYKYCKSREIEGKIKTVTVKRDTLGDLYLYVVTDFEESNALRVRTGKMAGADFGLKTFLTLSDGGRVESPQFYRESVAEVRIASRKVSSKVKGSKNRKMAVLNLSRKHKKVANQRKDHHWKLALELCRNYDSLFFEDLNLRGMKALWGRKVSDLGFYSFLRILEHVAVKQGVRIGYVDRFFASSKTCSVCGHIHDGLELRDRSWSCPSCGAELDRDHNAATNILRAGASALGGEVVRPALAG